MAPVDKKSTKRTRQINKWYSDEDEKRPFVRRQRQPKATTLRQSITPGTVLILLGGRFRGKRVVFLKQLSSGLLLVTGPYKINGVPLKRVNQAYVQPTSTKVDVKGVDVAKIDDDFFKRVRANTTRANLFKADPKRSEEVKQQDEANKKERISQQSGVDKALLANIKSTNFLAKYLSSRFTITNNMKVHELKW
ncbi:Translation protein SH3-like domain [Pseudocohnilembus persalinus]|uniref:Translation protein SH3-like domain n=1 Tax=Pseudocohnilembus persalinus TaxID=266149 RepID=A0A0V0QP22_PSEPJ|nr:Translation protein SH3-like domain [Pseudocohnilembus persalinus]|eukprot:KRX04131.1 Translation protein SH3-like domain [Pseudocohnilembus persalinus]